MKYLFILLSSLSFTNSIAQIITLPTYQLGQYENNTIYTYYGSLGSVGRGTVSLRETLQTGFITGVHFKMIVDSINQGAAPTHAAFRDSLGTQVPMYKGDTLDIFASFELFSGQIGFHVIVEGTPQIAGESYLCDLGYTHTLGNDFNMIIEPISQNSCLVDQSNGFDEYVNIQKNKLFPNPSTDYIQVSNLTKANNYIIYNSVGTIISEGTISNAEKIEVKNYSNGIYFLKFENGNALKFIKE